MMTQFSSAETNAPSQVRARTCEVVAVVMTVGSAETTTCFPSSSVGDEAVEHPVKSPAHSTTTETPHQDTLQFTSYSS